MPQALPDEVVRAIQKALAAEAGVEVDRDVAARIHTTLAPVFSWTAAMRQRDSSHEVTVLLADLRGFNAIFESHKAEVVLRALNRFFARMSEIAVENGGTIDKFLGDAIMVLFGAPHSGDDDARRAVTCAVQMQIAMEAINRENAESGMPLLYIGVAINTGKVMAGTLGSALHSEYTVIGDEVNLVSRIEAFSLRGQVLISESTFERCDGFVSAGPPMEVRVKGKSLPVRVYEVLAIPSLALQSPRQDLRKGLRVETRLPFEYRTIANKIVLPRPCSGTVLDLSYDGMLAEVEHGLAAHGDMLVILDLASFGAGKHELYAKVRSVRHGNVHDCAGIEFTSISPQAEKDIRELVQFLIQGSSLK